MSLTRRQVLFMGGNAALLGIATGSFVYFTDRTTKSPNESRLVSLEGKVATNFSLRDGNKISSRYDQNVSLSPYEEKLTLVNFWEIWCGFCRRELPDIALLHDKYSDKLRVLGVNMHFHSDISDLKEAYESFNAQNKAKNTVKFPLLGFPSDAELKSQKEYDTLRAKTKPIERAFEVDAVPRTLIISPQGIIKEDLAGARGFAALEKLVKKYL